MHASKARVIYVKCVVLSCLTYTIWDRRLRNGVRVVPRVAHARAHRPRRRILHRSVVDRRRPDRVPRRAAERLDAPPPLSLIFSMLSDAYPRIDAHACRAHGVPPPSPRTLRLARLRPSPPYPRACARIPTPVRQPPRCECTRRAPHAPTPEGHAALLHPVALTTSASPPNTPPVTLQHLD
ncbi:hypothetical protein JB92DRAFT_828320 [Gautieria morchelliformis]|nr:hypothetical protein JB92DRAFT_828320 [Gautieria morchelliformis]